MKVKVNVFLLSVQFAVKLLKRQQQKKACVETLVWKLDIRIINKHFNNGKS